MDNLVVVTGSTPALSQDECAALSRWLAAKPGARRAAKIRALEIEAGLRLDHTTDPMPLDRESPGHNT